MSCTNSEKFLAPDGSLIALVDCDTFYVSCERVCRPDLIGKPVVVLSNNDGCIVARSREAKKLGIPMGEPEYKVRHLLRQHGVAVFSSNYTLYGDLSHRVMQTLGSIVPKIEVYSIDEAFVPLGGALATNANAVAQEMRQRVRRWVGVPVSIGIAPTKTLAKIATRVAKDYPAYHGIFNLSESAKIDKLLESVAVKDIWGVGRKGSLKLRGIGIHNARQLRDAEPGLIRKLLTIHGLNMVLELRGAPTIWEEIPASHSTIISSRSLGYKVTTLEPLEEAAAYHAARAAEKLRQKKHLAQLVSVRIQTAYYAHDKLRHDEMTMVRLPRPTCDTSVIIRAVQNGLRKIFKTGHEYAKLMVMLTDLSNPAKSQGNLIDLCDHSAQFGAKRLRLMQLMDRINRVEGRATLAFAAQGAKMAAWHMKRERLSPCWTTDLQNLLRVTGLAGTYAFSENQEQL